MSRKSVSNPNDFDSYHKWLGIPKSQRPPTLYQLLAISPNETDVEVIAAAADRQQVKGSGFHYLGENESLEILLCGGCPITDNNFVHLKSCNRLSVLGLIDTNVTDAGMQHLRDIPTLKELRLNGTRLTDKGIQKLTTVKGLTKLSVGRTKVTSAGVNTFKKALPTCEVQLQ